MLVQVVLKSEPFNLAECGDKKFSAVTCPDSGRSVAAVAAVVGLAAASSSFQDILTFKRPDSMNAGKTPSDGSMIGESDELRQ